MRLSPRPSLLAVAIAVLVVSDAQAQADSIFGGALSNFQTLLDSIYSAVITGAGAFVSASSLIGALGAITLVSLHIYNKQLSGEPLDVRVLARPVCIFLALVFYSDLITIVNGALNPLATSTAAMVDDEFAVVGTVLEEMRNGSERNTAYASLVGPNGVPDFDKYLESAGLADDAGLFGINRIGHFTGFVEEAFQYQIRTIFRHLIFWITGILYAGVIIVVNTIRVFTLAVLAVVGPAALCFSLWPAFANSFVSWLGRYVTVFLWLPIANLFGFIIAKIQETFMEVAMVDAVGSLSSVGGTFDLLASDALYLILLITGIVGYLCIPSIASYVVSASGAAALSGGVSGVAQFAGRAALFGGARKVVQGAAAAATGGAAVAAGAAAGGVTINVAKASPQLSRALASTVKAGVPAGGGGPSLDGQRPRRDSV